MDDKIVSRPYDRDGEESYKRVFGDRRIPQYMVVTNSQADPVDQEEKEGTHE